MKLIPAKTSHALTRSTRSLSELTARTLAGVRRMSQALRPLTLEDQGLVVALQAMTDELEGQLGRRGPTRG